MGADSSHDRETIKSVDELEDNLSEPTRGVIETLSKVDGDIIVLGAGGKMGPTLARMARRASDAAGVRRRVIGVSRFSSDDVESRLNSCGVETIRADLLDEGELDKLPDSPNVVHMVGMKFGATGNEALTWAVNSCLPAVVSLKYRESRIVAFSTGNVYGLMPVTGAGSVETDAPGPIGEYAMSCLGRERVFEHFSRRHGTAVALVRLNYATELRYGVLVDFAERVWAGEPVDLATGHVNTIWQADANAAALSCFERVSSPPFVLNVTGPEILSVRRTCEEFGRLMGKGATFTGTESAEALLSSAELCHGLFGPPLVSPQEMMRLIADWVMRGGERLGKPTHFEVRDGRF